MENLCAKIDEHFRLETIRSSQSHNVHGMACKEQVSMEGLRYKAQSLR